MSETPGVYKIHGKEVIKCAHCNKDLDEKTWYVLTISTFRDGTDDHYSILLCNVCMNKILTKVFRLPEKKKKVK